MLDRALKLRVESSISPATWNKSGQKDIKENQLQQNKTFFKKVNELPLSKVKKLVACYEEHLVKAQKVYGKKVIEETKYLINNSTSSDDNYTKLKKYIIQSNDYKLSPHMGDLKEVNLLRAENELLLTYIEQEFPEAADLNSAYIESQYNGYVKPYVVDGQQPNKTMIEVVDEQAECLMDSIYGEKIAKAEVSTKCPTLEIIREVAESDNPLINNFVIGPMAQKVSQGVRSVSTNITDATKLNELVEKTLLLGATTVLPAVITVGLHNGPGVFAAFAAGAMATQLPKVASKFVKTEVLSDAAVSFKKGGVALLQGTRLPETLYAELSKNNEKQPSDEVNREQMELELERLYEAGFDNSGGSNPPPGPGPETGKPTLAITNQTFQSKHFEFVAKNKTKQEVSWEEKGELLTMNPVNPRDPTELDLALTLAVCFGVDKILSSGQVPKIKPVDSDSSKPIDSGTSSKSEIIPQLCKISDYKITGVSGQVKQTEPTFSLGEKTAPPSEKKVKVIENIETKKVGYFQAQVVQQKLELEKAEQEAVSNKLCKQEEGFVDSDLNRPAGDFGTNLDDSLDLKEKTIAKELTSYPIPASELCDEEESIEGVEEDGEDLGSDVNVIDETSTTPNEI